MTLIVNHYVLCTDLALKILENDQSRQSLEKDQSRQSLALARDANGEIALHVLARKPSKIANKSQLGI